MQLQLFIRSAVLLLLISTYLLGVGAAHANVTLTDLTRVDSSAVSVTSEYGGYNRRTGQFLYNVTVTNTSADTFTGPVYLAIDSITPTLVTVANADETSTEGTPTFVIPADSFTPGQTLSKGVLFNNSSRVRFSFTTTVYIPGQVAQDTTPPQITSETTPAPNAAGWNNQDVTVSFDCTDTTSGIASCTGPVLVSTEGANQVVEGQAVDNAGNTASTSVELNIDKTDPAITINSPADGSTFGTQQVILSGTVEESLSGLSVVTCNGTAATVTGSAFSCDLLLSEGANTVNVVATDLAGNEASNQINVSYSAAAIPAIGQVNSNVFSDNDNVYSTGRIVRIDTVETSGAVITEGTIRITSASQGYDSGIQPLKFLTFRSIFYEWDTTGLNPSTDYVVEVSLTDSSGNTTSDNTLTVTLAPNPPAINKLVSEIDVSVPAPGFPINVVRSYLLDSTFNGAMGHGWTHSYRMYATETLSNNSTQGTVHILEADGSGSYFWSNGDGTYQSPIGDFRSLTKTSNGSYVLRDKSGTTFTFNPVGSLASVSDRNGNIHILSHNKFGQLETITNSSGQITTFTYDSFSRVTMITDPTGRNVTYAYDSTGNLTSVTNNGGFTTTYAYDIDHNMNTITDPTGKSTFFTVDAEDRLASTSGEGGENSVAYQYSVPTENQMTVTDALGNQTVMTFDNNGLVTQVIDPLGNVTQMSYDTNLNLISQIDGNGSQTAYTYDERGNLLTTTDALGDTVTMTYEPVFNQMTSLTDAKAATITFAYDGNGNRIASTYSDGTTETFTYDTAGRLTSRTNRLNQTTNLAYDSRDLLTAKDFPDGSSDTFTYDPAGNLLSAADENGLIGFTYDSLDRLIEVSYPGGQAVSYAYDASNNRSQITYPDGTVLDYEYDEVNRLIRISELAQLIASYAYDPLSRVVRRDLGNGSFSIRSYDQSGRLLNLTNRKSNAVIISSFLYTYDNLGNRLTMTTLSGTTMYSYDATSQLTGVSLPGGSTISYNLDASGNRNSVNVDGNATSYTTNDLNQYTDVGGDSYTYDANGNLTSKTTLLGVTIYTYDFENQLVRVDTPTGTSSYTYDPFGRRTSKATFFGTTGYIYDDLRIIAETDVSGEIQATYIFGISIDEVIVMNRGGVDVYYAQDGLGSVTDLLDSMENIVESFSYDAYGMPSSDSSVGNPYLFTGREFDPETGLYFYRARYYDPEIGRFITTDPIGFAGGTNLYNYVSNNPINFVDPLGLFSNDWGSDGLRCSGNALGCIALCGEGAKFFGKLLGWLLGNECEKACEEIQRKCSDGGNVQRGDPTFLQSCQTPTPREWLAPFSSGIDGLRARIEVPLEGSLVRADVPVFGLAYGNDFQNYRVEYGQGEVPAEWITIATSDIPQVKAVTESDLNGPGDTTLHGSLATWDTGLKNYVYLPSHPKDHPVDLKGTYTVRLVVEGINGNTIEDRVTVNVGNVIPNAWGGKVTSPDGRFVLDIPEQAIMDSFRILLAQADVNSKIKLPKDKILVGNIYEVLEHNETFTKKALLELSYTEEGLGKLESGRLAMFGFNTKKTQWENLDSYRRRNDNALYTEVSKLHSHYALMASDKATEHAQLEPEVSGESPHRKVSLQTYVNHFLVKNDFENGSGQWSNRDGMVGATVTLDTKVTFDGSKALKITNTHFGGNFAVNVVTQSFDVRHHPTVQFDYRIPEGVKTNFLVKVSGRWYEIGFTDDEKELRNKRVNIAHIGHIENVVADDQWHTAQFNLYEMLRTKTGHTLVDEMIMADWDVGGYMKLQFGKNKNGATYYIDNFAISREVIAGLIIDSDTLLIDNFNQRQSVNALGGVATTFVSADASIKTTFSEKDVSGRGYALKMKYNVSQAGEYAGYISSLKNLDLRSHQLLSFYIKGEEEGADVTIGLKDRSGHESKIQLNDYLTERSSQNWQQVSVPLTAFTKVKDWAGLESLSLSFTSEKHDKGTVLVDNITFEKDIFSLLVDSFEREDKRNAVGREQWTYVSGLAAINGKHTHNSPNGIYRISYGGNIGKMKAYASELKSFAGWATQLGGIDCSKCDSLSFRVRGGDGEENPSIYLDDGNFRWAVNLTNYVSPTSKWQDVSIPLSDFEQYGVDLTHLDELQFTFEGEGMSGTIYLDDLRFGRKQLH